MGHYLRESLSAQLSQRHSLFPRAPATTTADRPAHTAAGFPSKGHLMISTSAASQGRSTALSLMIRTFKGKFTVEVTHRRQTVDTTNPRATRIFRSEKFFDPTSTPPSLLSHKSNKFCWQTKSPATSPYTASPSRCSGSRKVPSAQVKDPGEHSHRYHPPPKSSQDYGVSGNATSTAAGGRRRRVNITSTSK